MNELSSTEILTLENGISYAPVWISTDKRISDPEKTSLKYSQVGGPTASDKIGNAYGPIFRIEVLDASESFIKIWGLDNDDDNAPVYPIARFTGTGASPILDVWLQKFEFTDVNGIPVAAGTYQVLGHRKRKYPIQF